MVICPDCGKDVPESKFCKNCGSYISNVKVSFCSACGSKLDGDYKFCPECGAGISDVEEDKQVIETEVLDKSGEMEDVGSVPEVEVDDSASVEEEETSLESDNVDDEVPVTVEPVDEASLESENVEVADSVPVPVEQEVDVSDEKAKFCFSCGNKIIGDYKFCPECGQDLSDDVVSYKPVATSSGEKNILLAIILSVFLPGLGQIYLGLDHKGAIFLIAYVISAILILILIGFLLCFVIWIWALVDTIISTNALNRGDEVKDKLF